MCCFRRIYSRADNIKNSCLTKALILLKGCFDQYALNSFISDHGVINKHWFLEGADWQRS